MDTNLTVGERIELIKSVGEEVIGLDELPTLLTSGEELICYDGMEPSGQLHIAQGIFRAINTNKMIKAGFKFKFYVADWFAFLNNKMGGDMEKIQTAGKYFIEIWKACGMDLDNVEFVWASDLVHSEGYWEMVMKVANAATLNRILKTTQIMGRSDKDTLQASQILYPCMQTTDIYKLGARVTQLGMDQRKVNMLARDLANELHLWKPIVVSNHMIMGLSAPKSSNKDDYIEFPFEPDKIDVNLGNNVLLARSYYDDAAENNVLVFQADDGLLPPETVTFKPSLNYTGDGKKLLKKGFVEQYVSDAGVSYRYYYESSIDRVIGAKMSKSIPDSAIFMTDSREDIERKIKKAYCLEGSIEDNPILEYCKYLIFESHYLKGRENLLSDGFIVRRPEKWGGDIVYRTYAELEKSFAEKSLSAIDLKMAVIEYIDALIKPVRDHFSNNAEVKALLEQVQGFQITR